MACGMAEKAAATAAADPFAARGGEELAGGNGGPVPQEAVPA